MNFVVIKHPNDNGKYLFKVPEGVALDAGTMVACDTSRGKNQPGFCATATFEGDPEVVAPMWGGDPKKIRKVTQVLREFVLEWPEEAETAGDTPIDEDDD